MHITSGGVHKVEMDNYTAVSAVYVSGHLGGAAVNLGYVDDYGNEVLLTDSSLVTGKQYRVEHGVGVNLNVIVFGGTGVDFSVLIQHLA